MKRSAVLWTLTIVVTLSAAVWQRRTGPSYPYRTAVSLGSVTIPVRLPRSHETTGPALVAVPARDSSASGTLFWRRYPTSDSFTAAPTRHEGDLLAAHLPVQPPAGKVEYYVEVVSVTDSARIPAARAVVLRYHGPVPVAVLVPHVALMFLGLLIGSRAALGAVANEEGRRPLILLALALFTVGGLVLGPIVQNHAFGAYWTGVPFGWDLTDNKTLLMWMGWLVAAIAPRRHERWIVIAAAVLMLAAYVVPHSTFGSELDYSQAVR